MKDIIVDRNFHIETHLGIGRENIKTSAQIEAETGLSKRQVQTALRNARLRNVPVVSEYSNGGGSYIAANKAEAERYYNSQFAMNCRAFLPLRAFKPFLDYDPGQLTLEDVFAFAEAEKSEEETLANEQNEDR